MICKKFSGHIQVPEISQGVIPACIAIAIRIGWFCFCPELGIDGNIVKVRLQGACAGCPMSQMTLKNGIEKVLKEEIPEIESVENVG